MVEHSAVNRRVVGSSPTRGATPRDCPNEVREGPVATSESEVVRDCVAALRLAEGKALIICKAKNRMQQSKKIITAT